VISNGWFGQEGKFTVHFTLKKNEDRIEIDMSEGNSPVITNVAGNTCRTLTGIPCRNNDAIGYECMDTTLYTLVKKVSDGVWQDVPTGNVSVPLSSASIDVGYD
jgi:hypothetical protein